MEDLRATAERCRRAHQELLDELAGLTEETVRRPSLLPRWSVGHLLTHLARSADACLAVLEGAGRGEQVVTYPGGADQRAADIDRGARQPAAEILRDLAGSCHGLEQAFERAAPAAWQGAGRNLAGALLPCAELPFLRWREVEVHRVDLGLGYAPEDWPEDYVAAELPRALASVPGRLDRAGDRAVLLAWLLDRAPQPVLHLDGWQAPAPPHGG